MKTKAALTSFLLTLSLVSLPQAQAADSSRKLIEGYRQAMSQLKKNNASHALKTLPTDEQFVRANLNTDRLQLLRARSLYQNAQYNEAVAEYSKIPKESDFWVLAVEERAHTFGKMGQYEKAIADFTTLFSPVFVNSISPETYFTAALTYLRLCQYGKIYETIELFKIQMRDRLTSLQALSDRQNDALILSAAQQMHEDGLSNMSYAKSINQLPLRFHLNYAAFDLLSKKNTNASTMTSLSKLVAKMAKADLQDIETNLNKLQLVEAEIMQRLHIVENNKDDKRRKAGNFKKAKNQVEFPFNGEIWIDELDAYQVQAKECPTLGKGA